MPALAPPDMPSGAGAADSVAAGSCVSGARAGVVSAGVRVGVLEVEVEVEVDLALVVVVLSSSSSSFWRRVL